MEYALGKIYAKFYICQILNSMSYFDMKTKQLELQQLIEDNVDENDPDNSQVLSQNTYGSNNGNKSYLIKDDYEMKNENEKNSFSEVNNTGIKSKNSFSHKKDNRENLNTYDNPVYRRYFVFKNVVYSKVEIQGIVIEKRALGYEEKNNYRFLIYIDDSTGVIQAIAWKNKNDAIFSKIEKDLNPGNYVRVLGQVDYFLNSFEIVLEQLEVIKNFTTELLFHQTLQKNQSAINDSNIFNLLNLENNIYRELNDKKKYAHQKKDFANRLLAFFQKYSINNEKVKDGFIELNIIELFKIRQFNLMMEEFCNENRIEEKEKFFKECFNLLEEHSLGRLLNNQLMEIKVDDSRIKEEIMALLRNCSNGKTYIEIFDEISLVFNNFFMNDYVKFILSQLTDEEWSTPYLRDMDALKEIILKNSEETSNIPRRKLVSSSFNEEYLVNYLEKNLKDIDANPYIKFSNYQEYRLLTLLNSLNTAKLKFQKNRQSAVFSNHSEMGMIIDQDIDNNFRPRTSQLKLVNDIIKNSFELTSYLYILEWLQKIYTKDENYRDHTKERICFDRTCRNLIQRGGERFSPDLLLRKNQTVDQEEMEKFNRIMESIVIRIRQGKLDEAQKTAEYYNQSFLSAMLTGGLAMNDFILDNVESFKDFDWDLLPPFMKNNDYQQLKKNLNFLKTEPNLNSENKFDKVVGNPNWQLWFNSVYEACDVTMSDDVHDKNHFNMKLLQSYLSGNPSFIDSQNLSIHDSLYSHVMSIFNFKLIEEYNKKSNNSEFLMLDYHFIDQDKPDYAKNYNKLIKGKDINSLINFIKSKDKYLEAVKKDYTLFLELELIQLHFTDESQTFTYYRNLDCILENLIMMVNSSAEFNEYIRTHYTIVDNSINSIHDRTDLRLSHDELHLKDQETIGLIKLNYLKIIFTTLISFCGTNFSKFELPKVNDEHDRHNNNIKKIILEIFIKFDFLIGSFFEELSHLNIRWGARLIPKKLVYILCFCLDIQSVQEKLTTLAKNISQLGQENYLALVEEIDLHFKEYQENLNINIANNTKIYEIPANICSIDEILDRDLKHYDRIISPEDEIRISQIRLLLAEEKLEKITILKFMLKLALKFISSNKFSEAFQLDSLFAKATEIGRILGLNFAREYDLMREDLNFIYFLENNLGPDISDSLAYHNLSFYDIGIYYTVLFSKFALKCYFDYRSLCEIVLRELQADEKNNRNPNVSNVTIRSRENLTRSSKDLIQTFGNFIRLIRVLVFNKEIREVLISIFDDEVYLNDIANIISKWIYQILKWTVDLYTQESFRRLNFVTDDGLEIIIDLLNLKDDDLFKKFLVENNPDFLEAERSFFRFMDENHERRKEILGFIYKMGKSNKNLLSELFDDHVQSKLEEDIENFQF